jgi:hypothetical protein
MAAGLSLMERTRKVADAVKGASTRCEAMAVRPILTAEVETAAKWV